MNQPLALAMGQTTSPRPPSNQERWLTLLLAAALTMFLISALSGCSTAPATKAPWSPPQATLAKSEPLPKLADDQSQPDDAQSTIGIADLVDDNFNLVKAYKRLAKRHDELVDAVMQHLRAQAK